MSGLSEMFPGGKFPSGQKLQPSSDNESDAEEMGSDSEEENPTQVSTAQVGASSIGSMMGLPQQQVPVVYVDFSDGHTVRQIFEFFRAGLPCAPMMFTERGIEIERANGFASLFVRCFISRRNLISYSFNKARCNDPAQSRHIINFDLPGFNTQVKSLAKKEGIRLAQYAENPDYIFGQPYGGVKTTSQGAIFFRSQQYEPVTYRINDEITPDTIPNQVISLSSFCSACINACRSKYPYAYIMTYPDGVRIVAGNETGSTGRRDAWGDCSGFANRINRDGVEEKVQIEPFVTCIPLADIKALTKTSNLHQSGIVRVYSSRQQLTRLEIPAGSLCEITIILQGKDPEKIMESSQAGTRRKKKVIGM
jgi:hypothetical protein